jgi:hypothetical protein
MPTNVYSPNGLLWSRNRFGGAPTVQAQAYKIKSGYSGSNIAIGDVVKTGTSASQGYVVISAFGDTSGLGVFAGVLPYYDKTFQQTAHGLNGSYQTSSNPSADIDCLVISDFLAVFRGYLSGGPWTVSMRGQNISWVTGTNGVPNGAGVSTLGLDATTINTTNTLPFRIEGVVGVSGGPQDPANTNPLIEVSINPNWLEAMLGTGI